MSLPAHLTDEEIESITEPLTQGAARIRYLRRLGIKAEPKPNGQPLVWRADFEAVRQRNTTAANDGRQASADWTQFDKRLRYGRGAKEKKRQPARA